MSKIYGSIKNKVVDSDLQAERDKCDFDIKYGKALLHNPTMDEVVKFLNSDSALTNNHTFYDLNKEEKFEYLMKKLSVAWQNGKDKWWKDASLEKHPLTALKHGLGLDPIELSWIAFFPALYKMSTDEQFAIWGQ